MRGVDGGYQMQDGGCEEDPYPGRGDNTIFTHNLCRFPCAVFPLNGERPRERQRLVDRPPPDHRSWRSSRSRVLVCYSVPATATATATCLRLCPCVSACMGVCVSGRFGVFRVVDYRTDCLRSGRRSRLVE